MPKIRTIKPETWKSESVALRLPGPDGREARLLWIAMWNFAEDHGVIRANPRYLLNEIFPYDEDLTPADIERLLGLLARAGRIVRYSVGGLPYLQIANFGEHQKPNRPTPPTLPAADHPDSVPIASLITDDSVKRHASLKPLHAVVEGSGVEGSGEALKKNIPPPPTTQEAASQVCRSPDSAGTEQASSRPKPNAVSPDVALWLQFVAMRSKALPRAVEESPPPEWSVWRVEALRTLRGDKRRLLGAYAAFLASAYWLKQTNPCPIRAFLKHWRDFIPDQRAEPESTFRLLKPGEDPYADELPEHLKQAQAVKS